MRRVTIIAAGASALLVLAACGGGGDSGESASTPAESAPASAESSVAAGGLVTSYQDAQSAVIQIRAEGEFQDVGMAEGVQDAWKGSGFIIDPSGLAVTNAHVAEGAATLAVFVGGDSESVNAQILGISECDDLAVIDLEGDGYAYLAWHEGPVDVTTPVWAAGFPLGDPQYTVTDGSIAKNNADGQQPWASLDYTYESTAPTQPGNSGGPLLAEDGTVVGVNFAGGSVTNQSQFFAIPAALAKSVVEQLKTGEDTHSIGVNGQAFWDQEASIAGIWVSGVRSGSPASEAGIQAGDIITQLEGRNAVSESDLETTGGGQFVSKAGYCDVLKTQGTDQPIKVQVFRPTTGEILEGEVNNLDRPLVAVSALTTGTGATEGNTSTQTSGDITFSVITDDTGSISAEVPDVWPDRSTSGSELVAAVDLAAFNDGNSTGIDFYVVDGALGKKDMNAAMKEVEQDPSVAPILGTCENSEAGTVTEAGEYMYVGDSFWTCQGSDLGYYLEVRSYAAQQKSVLILVQVTTDQDVELANRSLASLVVN